MAKDHRDVVQKGLKIKKIGNEIMTLIGGREIHPINVRVGGFYKAPVRSELESLVPDLEWGYRAAEETIRWVANLPFPDFEQDYEFVALRHADEYPFNEGTLVSNKGLDIPIRFFFEHVEETHVRHSTSLHAHLKERGTYLVGPMARYALNFDKLSPTVQDAARSVGLGPICRNPFKSIIVRSLEMLHAFEEALRIIEEYQEPERPVMNYTVRAGTGHGCTEAPRGICYHRYTMDAEGLITDAVIVPPTSQNQARIEDDLYEYVTRNIDLPDDKLQWQCEQAIRNYDPCISCSCHFLKLKVDRG
jgi:coenzyme F420-reducing hydrogenase alpha subunit